MKTGKLPEDWKSANVTPIFKKGSKSDGKHYSLTSIICKVLETLVRKQLTNHLHTIMIFFLSTSTTQLLEVLDEWTRVLDDGGTIDVVYMDFMKAFDTPHHRLICKLEAYGVQLGKLLAWIRALISSGKTPAGCCQWSALRVVSCFQWNTAHGSVHLVFSVCE